MTSQTVSRSTLLAVVFMLISTILLALMHTLVRSVSSDIHPFVIAFFRNLFGLIALSPLLLRSGLSSLHTTNPKLHVLRAFVGIGAMLFFFTALSKVPITNATALSFSTTIFAALSAWLFLKEKMRIRRWAAIFVGLIGVMIALQPTAAGFNSYSFLVICSAVAWGCSITIVRQLGKTESPTTIVGWMGISLTLLSIGPALWFWQTPDLHQLSILFLIGALGTGGHLLLTRALKLADVAIVMSIDFSRLIWSALFGAWFFAESLDSWTVVGAAIIFLAGWYIIFRESQLR